MQNEKPCNSLKLSLVLKVLKTRGLLLANSEATTWDESGIKLSPSAIRTDAKVIEPGDLYIAYRGVKFDGHANIELAIARGAAAVVIEDKEAIPVAANVAWALTKNSRAAWSWLVAATYGNPQERLRFVAVTGTNGKTSVVWMTKALLARAGRRSISVGTLGAWIGDDFLPTKHTTPDPDALFGFLRQAVDRSLETVAMEASSIAIAQERFCPLRFSAAAFTSFSRDHLDFHGDMDAYLNEKWRLFANMTDKNARLVFCAGLASAIETKRPVSLSRSDTWIYGRDAAAVAASLGLRRFLEIKEVSCGARGTELVLARHDGAKLRGVVPFFGYHALENFVAALLLAEAVTGQEIPVEAWAQLPQVPGRLELVVPVNAPREKVPKVFVDYAHTPDALVKALETLRAFTPGKLWVVFGCGGDRDRGKRPEMARIAERLADRVIITTDNPRTEPPQSIIDEIAAGLTQKETTTAEVDRAKAIALAVREAGPTDTVLVAGKGHEDYQIVGTAKIPFDDRKEALKVLEEIS